MPLRPKSALHSYQDTSITHLYNSTSALALLPVGAGKTVVGWTAAVELMDDGIVKRPIVFAPRMVAINEWPGQREDWEHLKDREMVDWSGEPSSWPDSPWKRSRQFWGQRVHAERQLPNVNKNMTVKNETLIKERHDLAVKAKADRHAARKDRTAWKALRTAIIIQQNKGIPLKPAELRKKIRDKEATLEELIAGVKALEKKVNKEIRAMPHPELLHCTSYENIEWFCDLYPDDSTIFDLWIFDEIGKLKNPTSPRYKLIAKRTKAVLKAGGTVWGLNATPAPEGLLDLFTQVKIVDGGKLWGDSYYKWRDQFFVAADFQGYSFRPQLGARKLLMDDLNTLAFRVDEKDLSYIKTMQHNQIKVTLPPKARTAYDEMEKHQAVEIDRVLGRTRGTSDEAIITALSAASASMKLRQITQGFIYDEEGKAHILHDEKAQALGELIEQLNGEPLLVAYEFKEDLEAIRKVWKKLPYIGDGVGASTVRQHIEDWNARRLPVLAIHPQCLHPATLVLTEYRGWTRIVDVQGHERVFDGVEFVSHHGVQLSGVRPVINRFGVTMTPDHPILINDEWVKAEDVRDTRDARAEARYTYTGDDPRLGALLELRGDDLSLPEGEQRRGCRDGGLPPIDVPSAPSIPVFDLVDCGPRHRFAVRNADGEVFIVHNSAGHGLNLQKGGSHIAWYCLPWGLEPFQQTCGRIDRQGQERACYAHHIVARLSMDQKVSDLLAQKDTTQREIIEAIRKI